MKTCTHTLKMYFFLSGENSVSLVYLLKVQHYPETDTMSEGFFYYTKFVKIAISDGRNIHIWFFWEQIVNFPVFEYLLQPYQTHHENLRSSNVVLGNSGWCFRWVCVLLTCACVGSSQHALHLVDGVLPAAGAGLHVRLQLLEPVAEVLVTFQRQLGRFPGHHQLLQVVLQDDHPDGVEGGEISKTTLGSFGCTDPHRWPVTSFQRKCGLSSVRMSECAWLTRWVGPWGAAADSGWRCAGCWAPGISLGLARSGPSSPSWAGFRSAGGSRSCAALQPDSWWGRDAAARSWRRWTGASGGVENRQLWTCPPPAHLCGTETGEGPTAGNIQSSAPPTAGRASVAKRGRGGGGGGVSPSSFLQKDSRTRLWTRSACRTRLQSRQAVVVGQLLGLLVPQVFDSQAEPQLLQRNRAHVVCHIINLRAQRKR